MRFLFCLFLALCLALSVQGRVWAVIDTFNTLQAPLIFTVINGDDPLSDYDWYSPYDTSHPPVAKYQTTTDALGGQRDLVIGYETTTPSNSVAIASVSAKSGSIALPLGYSGGVYYQYDGADDGGSTAAFPGSVLNRLPGIGSGGNPFGLAGGIMDFTFGGRAGYVTTTIFADHQCNYFFDAIDANDVRNTLGVLITPIDETTSIRFDVNFADARWTKLSTFDWTKTAAFQVRVFTFSDSGGSQAVDTSFKFLNITGYEIAGSVVVDCNCDSTTDSFVSGSTVTLQNPTTSATLATTTTDVNGDFFFYGRTSGNYRVCIDAALSRCSGQTQCRDITLANLIDPAKLLYRTTINSVLNIPVNANLQCGDCSTPTCLGFASTTGCSGTTQVNTFQDFPTIVGCTTNIRREWTANGQTLTQLITIQDTQSPVITNQAQSVSFPCNTITTPISTWISTQGGATATDCSSFSWTNNWDGVGPNQCGFDTVTFTARDVCGNPGVSTVATYTLTDTSGPTITTQAVAQTVECSAKNNNVQTALTSWLNRRADAVANDSCSGTTITWTNNYASLADPLDPLACLDFVDVTFTASDSCGNSATTVARFTVDDTLSASFTTPPQNVARQCAGTTSDTTALQTWVNNNGNSVFTDACSTNNADITVTNNYVPRAFNGCADSFAVTYTIQDFCGNTPVSAAATWSVSDNANPTITTQASARTVECDPASNQDDFDAWVNDNGGGRATDSCTAITWSDNAPANVPTGCSGSVVVIFTATDGCGKSITTQATYQVKDNTAPTFTTAPQSQTAECNANANTAYQTWLSGNAGAAGTDSCSTTGLTINHGNPALVTGCNRANVVSFTVADGCGNVSPAVTAQFLVTDTQPPVVTAPGSDLTIECNSATNQQSYNTWLSSHGGATAVDDCTTVTWTNDGAATLTQSCTFTRVVTFTASDGCGHSVPVVLSASITDSLPPVLTSPAATQDVQCSTLTNPTSAQAYTNWVNAHGFAQATDACGTVTWTNDAPATLPGTTCLSTATITFTASDACARSVTTQADYTIRDTSPPVIVTAAQTTAVQCDPTQNDNQFLAWINTHGGAVVQDACNTITWTASLFDAPFGCDSETVEFTADDGCGFSVKTTATFSIIDTVNPTFNPPATSVTVECDGAGNVNAFQNWVATRAGAQAVDACTTSITWTNDAPANGPVGCGSVNVGFTAADSCGGQSTTTATYRVADTVAPVISPQAAPQSAECDAVNNPVQIQAWLVSRGGAQATDTCYATSSLVWSNNFSGLVPLPCGSVATVTFSVSDPCNQIGRTVSTFTVTDSFPPQIVTPASNLVLECNPATNDADTLAWVNARGSASATDTCSSVTWVNDFVATPDPCAGPLVVGFSASDACGNRVTTLASVTIQDTIPPSFANFPPDVSVTCDEVTDSSMTGIPGFTDSCSTADVIRTESDAITVEPFERLCPGDSIITRTWRITDACGNFAERDQLLIVAIPQGPCIPQACIPCEDQPLLCCASSIAPVPCIPVACTPVDCTHASCNSVPCIPVTCGNGAPPPFQDDDDTVAPSPRPTSAPECEPIYIYVFDDDDGVSTRPVYTVSRNSSSTGSSLTLSLFSLFIALLFLM